MTSSGRGAWRERFRATPDTPDRRRFDADLRRRYPGFVDAIRGDARAAALGRGDRHEFSSTLDLVVQVVRLCVVTDAFVAVVAYRAKTECLKRRIPLLPRLFHRVALMSAQVCIGDPVVIQPGLCLPHGMVVIDGMTSLGRNVTLSPWVTVGLLAPDFVGPTIGAGSRIGTGAKVLGSITLGREVKVGANSVVMGDVPDRATAVGVPARVVERSDA
ncbi:MAG: hypothetical protein RIB98_10925 [Acidimicrobiales bacterium]